MYINNNRRRRSYHIFFSRLLLCCALHPWKPSRNVIFFLPLRSLLADVSRSQQRNTLLSFSCWARAAAARRLKPPTKTTPTLHVRVCVCTVFFLVSDFFVGTYRHTWQNIIQVTITWTRYRTVAVGKALSDRYIRCIEISRLSCASAVMVFRSHF